MLSGNLFRGIKRDVAAGGETVLSVTGIAVLVAALPFGANHIIVKWGALASAGNPSVSLRINGDSSALYNAQDVKGAGSSPTGLRTNSATSLPLGTLSSTAFEFSGGEFLIPAAFLATHKSVVGLYGEVENNVTAAVGRYASTDTVDEISLVISSGSYVASSMLEVGVVDEMLAIAGAEDIKTADGTFTVQGIPQLSGDVVLIGNVQGSGGSGAVKAFFNGDTTPANYGQQRIRGFGSSPTAKVVTDNVISNVSIAANGADVFGAVVMQVQNLSGNSNDPASLVIGGGHNTSSSSFLEVHSLRRDNIEPVTEITITNASGFSTGSMLSAYFVPKNVIAQKKLEADATSVTLQIPQGYRDIKFDISARTDRASTEDTILVEYNDDTTTANYVGQLLLGAGSSVFALPTTGAAVLICSGDSAAANIFGGGTGTVFGYTETDRHKHALTLSGKATNDVRMHSVRWKDPSAIVQVKFTPANGTVFKAGSIFTVEGIGKTKIGWEDDFGIFESILEVDTAGDESFGAVIDNLTEDGQLQTMNTMIGRSFPSTVTGHPIVGSLDAPLTNYDGDFSYYNSSSPYFQLIKKGRLIRIRTTVPQVRTIWFGVVDDLPADIADNQAKSAQVLALGPFSEFTKEQIRVEGLTNVQTDAGVTEILDKAGFSATRRKIGTGKALMPYWFVTPKLTLKALREIEASEGGAIVRESEEGDVVYEPEGFRLSIRGQTSQATFASDPQLGAGELLLRKIKIIRSSNQNVLNEISRPFTGYAPGSLEVVWTAPVDQTIPPGETRTFEAKVPNLTTTQSNVNKVAIDPVGGWTTPAVGTDVTGSSAPGGGTDLNGSLTVGSVSKFSNSMLIPIENTGSVVVYLSLLQARAVPLISTDPMVITDIDQDSKDEHGPQSFPNPDAIFVESAEEAHSANLMDLAQWSQPTPIITLWFDADSDSYRMAAALRLTLSDRITVRELGYYGINEDFYIERIKRAISPRMSVDGQRVDRMVVAYDLSPAAGFTGFFVWGFSEWDLSTRATRS